MSERAEEIRRKFHTTAIRDLLAALAQAERERDEWRQKALGVTERLSEREEFIRQNAGQLLAERDEKIKNQRNTLRRLTAEAASLHAENERLRAKLEGAKRFGDIQLAEKRALVARLEHVESEHARETRNGFESWRALHAENERLRAIERQGIVAGGRPIQFTCTHCGYVASTEYGVGLRDQIATLTAEAASLRAENERLRAQSERPKCMYCTFGEDADFTVDDLKQHIENECDFHPLRKLKRELAEVSDEMTDLQVAWQQQAERAIRAEARTRALVAALREVWESIPSSHDEADPMVQRHARALNAIHAALTEPTPPASESEGMLLRRLSDLLTGGNAGTWDEILHAAAALKAAEPREAGHE